ncbi:carboxypeptidase A2-like [Rhipicephalus microplus]|uniref:carboxypeptidase A2-like n=1 Tax=Rhipicephalus microplus TaxID=6941 RepID=UPI003F6CEF22
MRQVYKPPVDLPPSKIDRILGDAGRASPADPCSLTFYGDYAFSEIETRASRDALLGNRTEFFFDLHSYGTMWMFPCGHTDARVPEYDQLLIRQTLFRRGLGKNRQPRTNGKPLREARRCFVFEFPPSLQPQNTYVFNSNGFLSISLQLNISRRAAEAIEKVNGAVYKVGAMYETIYPMSGGSADWAYDKAGVRKSFSIELQSKQAVFDADFGFLLPYKDILPTVTEAWEGIKAAVLY